MCKIHKKVLLYVFWTLFLGLFCLMMGSASGVNNTFDRVLDYYGLNFGEYDYFEAASIYDEHDYKHEGDFTLVYYIKKNEDNLDDLIKQIVQENNSIYKRYQLSEIDVVYETNGIYYICEKGEVIAKVVVENDGLLKKVSYQWSREKLEQNSMDILRLLYSSHRNYYGQNMLPLSSDQIGSLSSFPVTFLSSA